MANAPQASNSIFDGTLLTLVPERIDPRAPFTVCGMTLTEVLVEAHTLLLDEGDLEAAELVRGLFREVDRLEYLVVLEKAEPFFRFPNEATIAA